MLSNKKAFTLAEVLITLTVIGIVASIVAPTLMQNYQDQQYKTAYKKAFTDISQVLLSARNNNELVDINASYSNLVSNVQVFENYFNATKTCTNSVDQNCWIDNCIAGEHDCLWTIPAGNDQGKSIGFIDNAGRSWILYKNNVGAWLILLVDTNGAKAPNRLGRDRFPLFFKDSNNESNAKAPIKITPLVDVINAGSNCAFGNCYYTSWLSN